MVARSSTTSADTVTVACKMPNGIVLDLDQYVLDNFEGKAISLE